MKSKLYQLRHYFIIALVIAILAFTNYTPDTYLTGWDNLQTDLRPALSLKRSVFSVWEEYQSFGLVSGMAHAADVIRSLLGLILSIFPQHLVRYMSFILYTAFGGFGMFEVLKAHTKHSKNQGFVALFGSLFYILNLGIIQLTNMPFEPFSYFFASFPWLIWALHQYVSTKKSRKLGILFLINVLATPSFYLQTLFVVYGLFTGLYLLGSWITYRKSYVIHKSIIALFIILAANAFWLLPQVYFVTTSQDVVRAAKINQLATDDVFYQNKEKGTVFDYLTLRGFYSDLENIDKQPLFVSWNKHFESGLGQVTLYIFVLLAVLGLFSKSKGRAYFLGPLALTALFMLNNTPLFEELNGLVRSNTLINQIFRSPFTKFTVVHAFIMSFFIAQGGQKLIELTKKSSRGIHQLVPYVLIFILLFYAYPAFTGNYFNKSMRTTIPTDYLDTIDYFKTVDPSKRIALMPDYTHWGWFFTDWGYNGSGFLWYGIQQPIISRTFDVWSPASESYFWEIKTAVEAEDIARMEQVLDKYAVDYVIVDHTLKPVSSDIRALQYDRLEMMLSESQRMKQFGFGEDLSLYTYDRGHVSTSFVSLARDIPSVGPSSLHMPDDKAYSSFGTYRSDSTPDVFYPFRNFTSQTRLFDDQWTVEEFDEAFVFTARLPQDTEKYALSIPSTEASVKLYHDGIEQTFTTPVSYEIDKSAALLHVTVPKTQIINLQPSNSEGFPCTSAKGDTDIHRTSELVRIYSNHGAVPCLGYGIPFLDQNHGYMVTVENRNIIGRRLFMSIADQTKEQPYIEDRLQNDSEHFIIAPRYEYGQGYTITFQNNSYDNLPSTNVIDSLVVFHLPYDQIADITMVKKDARLVERLTPSARTAQLSVPEHVNKRNYHAYTVDLSAQDMLENEYIVLNQAYHDGWRAYVVAQEPVSQYLPMLAGRKLTEHVRINTWSQGWKLPERCQKNSGACRIVFVFWPQYLQYLGFAVLVGVGYFAVFKKNLRT